MNQGKIDADNCFVCGKKNETGLKIEFKIEGDLCWGLFQPSDTHVGFNDIVHGGIIYSVLDDAMANWFYLQGAIGYTAKADIRYRSHMKVGETGVVKSRFVNRKGKLLFLKSDLFNQQSQSIIAECEGKFLLSSLGSLDSP